MKIQELPDWDYFIDEVSAGVYRLKAADQLGRVVDLTGPDPEKLVKPFLEHAKIIELMQQGEGPIL